MSKWQTGSGNGINKTDTEAHSKGGAYAVQPSIDLQCAGVTAAERTELCKLNAGRAAEGCMDKELMGLK